MLTILTLFLFTLSFTYTQNNETNQDYIKAMSAPKLEGKIQGLKDYLSKYQGKATQHENYVYAYLCLYSAQVNKPNESVDYGEYAITMDGLDIKTKVNVYITSATLLVQLGKNLEKAKNYALKVVEMAKENKNNESSEMTPAQWTQLIGAGYYTHAQAQQKAKQNKGAVNSYIKSYEILKNPQILKDMKKAGKALYDFKFYKDAEVAFKAISNFLKDFESYTYYAKSLYKNGKKEEALSNFRMAYMKKKSGEIAYNIGIILAGKAQKDPSFSQEAIRYLLDASYLSPSYSKKAREMAEGIFFNANENKRYNNISKDIAEINKDLEELVAVYNEKVEGKEEDEFTNKQRKIINGLLKDIEADQKKIEKLKDEQRQFVNKFNKLLDEAQKRLGVK